jgi:hypothetical protein
VFLNTEDISAFVGFSWKIEIQYMLVHLLVLVISKGLRVCLFVCL